MTLHTIQKSSYAQKATSTKLQVQTHRVQTESTPLYVCQQVH